MKNKYLETFVCGLFFSGAVSILIGVPVTLLLTSIAEWSMLLFGWPGRIRYDTVFEKIHCVVSLIPLVAFVVFLIFKVGLVFQDWRKRMERCEKGTRAEP